MSAPHTTMPVMGTSIFARIKGLVTEPSATFASILNQPTGIIWVLLLIIVPSVIAQVLYWQSVDFNYFVSVMAEPMASAEAEQMITGMTSMGTTGMMAMSVVSVIVAIPIVMAIFSGYLLLANRIAGTEQRSFKTWFAVVAYSSVFGAITGLGAIAHVLVDSSGQIMPEMLAVTNLNALVTQFPYGHDLYRLMTSIDLFSIVALLLMAVALIQNGHRAVSAVLIASMPSIIMWSISLM